VLEAPPGGFSPATPAELPGYSYQRNLHPLTATGPLSLPLAIGETAGGATQVALAPLDGAPLTYMVATGVGRNTEDRVPVLITRRKRTGVALGLALAPGAVNPTVEAVVVTTADGKPVGTAAAVRVRLGGATYLLISTPHGAVLTAGK